MSSTLMAVTWCGEREDRPTTLESLSKLSNLVVEVSWCGGALLSRVLDNCIELPLPWINTFLFKSFQSLF